MKEVFISNEMTPGKPSFQGLAMRADVIAVVSSMLPTQGPPE